MRQARGNTRKALPKTQLEADSPGALESPDDAADLTVDDHLAVETDKDAPDGADADLPVPDQDPAVVPPSVVDENGQEL
ncbi:MAG: hypothetical protein QOK35_977 [Pseudonocardiales bacterium]|nr:hypothetical protein [Pseudonocardiales bacterium]